MNVTLQALIMSGLLYTLLGLAASSSLHCAVRREISPCTCRQEDFSTPVITGPSSSQGTSPVGHPVPPHGERIEVECERMESFNQVSEALRGKFTPDQQIILRVSHSQLKDISKHGFKELKMSITRLDLNYDGLGFVHYTFYVHFFFFSFQVYRIAFLFLIWLISLLRIIVNFFFLNEGKRYVMCASVLASLDH